MSSLYKVNEYLCVDLSKIEAVYLSREILTPFSEERKQCKLEFIVVTQHQKIIADTIYFYKHNTELIEAAIFEGKKSIMHQYKSLLEVLEKFKSPKKDQIIPSFL
jgi:hypothetical protein